MNLCPKDSSIHVYQNLQHALVSCSTWMTSCVHLKKRRGLDIQDCYFVERMESNSVSEKEKKKGKTKNLSKTM